MKKPRKPRPKHAKKRSSTVPIGALGYDQPPARLKAKAQVVHRLAPEALRLTPAAVRARPIAIARSATPYSSDDQTAIALLLLPFVIVALSLGISQTLKRDARLAPVIALPAPQAEPRTASSTPAAVLSVPAPPPAVIAPEPELHTALAYPPLPPSVPATPVAIAPPAPPPPAVIALPGAAPVWPPASPAIEVAALVVPPPPVDVTLPGPAPMLARAAPQFPTLDIELPGAMAVWPLPLPSIDTGSSAEERQRLAAWTPPPIPWRLDPTPPEVDVAAPLADGGVCLPKTGVSLVAPRKATRLVAFTPMPAADFGTRLAAAAQAQTEDLVVYTARYHHMVPVMGDLPTMYGACSDLVIRAYRALGVDLQQLIQKARVGSGDPSIDHRRTETLRAFFSRHATVLAITAFPEDYKPGDIVTYYRPFSRVSRAHVAIVSDQIAPSGRPMIIHNRGWGPQFEDALFVDRITGHYRYAGPRDPATLIAGSDVQVPLPIPKSVMLAQRRVATGLAAKIK